MGGPCASRIDFPGAEFTPAAAASGTCGAPESGTERERELCRADPKRAPATPHRPLGSASPSRLCAVRPPSIPPQHTPELKTESTAHRSEVAETLEGGRALLGVLARPGILRHQQACLRLRVRVQGPPFHLALKLAPPRVRGTVAHNFELVGGVRTASARPRPTWWHWFPDPLLGLELNAKMPFTPRSSSPRVLTPRFFSTNQVTFWAVGRITEEIDSSERRCLRRRDRLQLEKGPVGK